MQSVFFVEYFDELEMSDTKMRHNGEPETVPKGCALSGVLAVVFIF